MTDKRPPKNRKVLDQHKPPTRLRLVRALVQYFRERERDDDQLRDVRRSGE